MKILVALLGLLALTAAVAQAQCKDCGCKEKCTPKCRCEHDEKSKAQ